MTYGDPFGRKPEKSKPKIWAEGGQRPPFDLRALGTATLHLSRLAVAPLHAWGAHTTRRVAVNVKNGVGRIPEAKLGRAARFVPSHLRVAAWIKNLAAILSHASASADPDVRRGNALVAEIEPHLWDAAAPPEGPPAVPDPLPQAEPVAPVTLPEPMQPGDDPLASIRAEIDDPPAQGRKSRLGWTDAPSGPAGPPAPPGPLATTAIQISGYLIGWGSAIVALPYGLIRALWMFARGVDLRSIKAED